MEELTAAGRLFFQLPGYLRKPVGPEQSRATLGGRVQRRETSFLTLLRRVVYAQPANPYRRLLIGAGCELGDVERLVAVEGLEGALLTLFRRGVYLTVEEFKGRRAVVRGSLRIEVQPAQLRMPGLGSLATNRTSGSRGASTAVQFNLGFTRVLANVLSVPIAARGGMSWEKGVWGVPGNSVLWVLVYSGFGVPLTRWYSMVGATASGLHARYRWAERAIRWGGILAGRRLPRPEQVSLDDPLPIARWMSEVLRRGRVPHLHAYVSPVALLCRAARENNLSLAGARFTVFGEPLTPAKLAAIEAVGATAASHYGSAELGSIGESCLAPAWIDEHHVVAGSIALIQPGSAGGVTALPPDALLGTSLLADASFFVINLSSGDCATMVRRSCDCALEQLGWTTHLHTLRSFEKLTAAGMTFLDGDVIRVLEELLPARFGGDPTSYQLVEQEAADGSPGLTLLIDPAVGLLDPATVAEAFLAAIGEGSGAERVMSAVWRTPGLLRVERCPPHRTATGKIHHVHRLASQAQP